MEINVWSCLTPGPKCDAEAGARRGTEHRPTLELTRRDHRRHADGAPTHCIGSSSDDGGSVKLTEPERGNATPVGHRCHGPVGHAIGDHDTDVGSSVRYLYTSFDPVVGSRSNQETGLVVAFRELGKIEGDLYSADGRDGGQQCMPVVMSEVIQGPLPEITAFLRFDAQPAVRAMDRSWWSGPCPSSPVDQQGSHLLGPICTTVTSSP